MAQTPDPKDQLMRASVTYGSATERGVQTPADHAVTAGAAVARTPRDPDRMTVNVYLPRRALPVIDEAARRMGIARSAWIRLAIIEKLRRDGEPDW